HSPIPSSNVRYRHGVVVAPLYSGRRVVLVISRSSLLVWANKVEGAYQQRPALRRPRPRTLHCRTFIGSFCDGERLGRLYEVLSLYAAGAPALNEIALDGREEGHGGHGDHDAGCHDHAPVYDGGVEEIVDAHRQRLQFLGGDEHKREQEVVP